jgi:glyoxylase-like metal-dependent hydrolase (beta-lactamase superfamily II)
MAVWQEGEGSLLAGDALGARFPPGGLYPTLPPPDVDRDRALATLDRLAALTPAHLMVAHFSAVPDPAAQIAEASRQQRAVTDAALRAWRAGGGRDAVARAVEEALPLERTVGDPRAVRLWRDLGWAGDTVDGLAGWAAAQDEAA